MAQPIPVPPGFAPAPPAPKRSGSRTLMIIGIVAVFLILVLGGGAFIANASLSAQYSPQKAVTDYLAAQSRGNVGAMMSNANFLKGGSDLDQLFNQDAVTAMLGVAENKSISSVSVTSTQSVDSSTSNVAVAMTWNGSQRTQTYVVHKDTTRVHALFYYSWRVDIPANSVTLTLPNQPGPVSVDGISLPKGTTALSVIQGFHNVTMASTDIYDSDSQTANAVDGSASVTFAGKFSADAMAAGAAAVKDTFVNGTCSSDYDCPGKTYKPQAGYYERLLMPGGEVDAYTNWVFTLVGDPTTAMKLTATPTTDKVNASGNCQFKLVVDGKSTYNYAGTWTAVLTYGGSQVGVDLTYDCEQTKA